MCKKKHLFFARASAFKSKLASKLLSSLHMIPVYRIRDGIKTIQKNQKIFEQCFEILKNNEGIEIFAEGEHHLERRILPFKKGFARIILGTLQKYPHLEIQIIPIGFNYDSHLNFPSSVSMYYGKSILANNFITPDHPDTKFTDLLNEVSSSLKKLTLHVEDATNYDKIIKKLEILGVDYLNPFQANELVKNIEKTTAELTAKKKIINWFTPIHIIAKLNSIVPLLIWKYLKSTIKDIIFLNTYRFALIITLFPIFYLIQTAIVYYFFNLKYALIYLGTCVILGFISTKTMTVS
ncbi:MAG: glycerol acyltransferase [Lutibacter sp.]|nr:MAG: glycerol acyltransferase [Lutibacter sp.]